jgi:pantoate--beta-alanine ligase
MNVFRTVADLRFWVQSRKSMGLRIGFVPTMGALHSGHLALIERANELADASVVSIFVNPTQFGPNEDLSRYPRPLEEDLEKCLDAGVQAVFLPSPEELYQGESFIHFHIDKLGDHLCGASRPGHFAGVVQIVNKLFNIVQPDVSVFGQKDYQQVRILERMVEEFNHPVELVMHPTVRSVDGLALSSRNMYLNDQERVIAPRLYATMLQLADALRENPKVLPALEKARSTLETAGFKIDYLSVVSQLDLQPVTHINGTSVIACAVYLGSTRLIDNLILEAS